MDISDLDSISSASYKTGSRDYLLLSVWCWSYHTVLCSRGRKECTASEVVLHTLMNFWSKCSAI